MGIYSLVISVLLVPLILFFEFFRKKEKVIDFLTIINITFFLAFGISPLYLFLFEEHTTWVTIHRSSIYLPSFFYGSILAVLFYIATVSSFYFSDKLKFIKDIKTKSEKIYKKVNNSQFFTVAFILFLFGGASLFIYVKIVGGFSEFLRVGPILRDFGSYIQHPFMFLKNFTPLLSVAAFMFYALIKETKGLRRFFVLILFVTSFVGGGLSIFHSGGRMQMFIFLITIPIAKIVHKNKLKVKSIFLFSTAFLVLVIFGRQLFNINNQKVSGISNESTSEIIGSVLQEFTFPFTNLGNLIPIYQNGEWFRGGILDILSASMQLVPSRIINLGIMQRDSASDFNTSLYNKITGEIPVDIVSFGYMSFGIAGVLLVGVFFGAITRMTQNFFSYTDSRIASVFYASFMILFGFRVMYGDPVHFVYSSFRYFVALLLIIIIVVIPKKRIVLR